MAKFIKIAVLAIVIPVMGCVQSEILKPKSESLTSLSRRVDGSKSNKVRPLVYYLEHQILPQAVFKNHPELERELQQNSTHFPLLHFWSKTTVFLTALGFSPQEVTGGNEYNSYLSYITKRMVLEPFIKNGISIWVITMPSPIESGEAYYVAICKRVQEKHEYMQPSPSNKYFILEHSEDKGAGFFLELTSDGSRRNFGFIPISTSKDFLALVENQLVNPSTPLMVTTPVQERRKND